MFTTGIVFATLPIKSKHRGKDYGAREIIYVVSALRFNSSPFEKLRRHNSLIEATDHAIDVINKRQSSGEEYMDFYVLKVMAKVGHASPPIKVERLK